MSYLKSQQTRQTILNHLHATKPAGCKDIAIAINIGKNAVESGLRAMLQRGEIERLGAGQATRYKAIATTTVSAEQIIEEMAAKRYGIADHNKAKAKAKQAPLKPCEPWRYRSKDYRNPYKDLPLQNQGGQGALRSTVFVASSAGMV
jgi:hypothetical protein